MKIRFILAVGLIAPAFSAFADTRDIHDAHIADVVINQEQHCHRNCQISAVQIIQRRNKGIC